MHRSQYIRYISGVFLLFILVLSLESEPHIRLTEKCNWDDDPIARMEDNPMDKTVKFNLPEHPRLLLDHEGIRILKERINKYDWAKTRWNIMTVKNGHRRTSLDTSTSVTPA